MRPSQAFWCLAALLLLAVRPAGAATLNELRVNGTIGASTDYVELRGTPSEDLDSLTFLAISGTGVIATVQSLAGQAFAADSEYFLFTNPDYGPTPNDFAPTGFRVSDGGDTTYLLVEGFTGALWDDVDTNNDGILDTTPWTSVVDSVAIETAEYTGNHYAATVLPDWVGYATTPHFFRDGDTGPWTFWNDSLCMDVNTPETPRAFNGVVVTAINETGSLSFLGGTMTVDITANSSGKSYVFKTSQVSTPGSFCFNGGTALSPDSTAIDPDTVADIGYFVVEVEPQDYTGLTYSISLDGTGLNGVADLDKIILVKRNSEFSCYELLDTTRVGNVFTASGLTSFSEFTFATVASQGGGLPVELDAFRVD